MTEITHEEMPFLISRSQAARRYGMSQRQFDELYRRHPEFPVLHIGRRVMVHREEADAFFTRNIRDVIEMD